tara:strand:+ start:218 stop:673 length:456 start_codon:yes stop_codon:yes gene_type:complete
VILISHRGNFTGPSPDTENSPKQIDKALNLDYNVEIDVWFKNNQFWLGHDQPTYPVETKFLQNSKLWCHAKNIDALQMMTQMSNVHFFWHQSDNYTLTSNSIIWAYPGQILTSNAICVMPEKHNYSDDNIRNCLGVCSDYIKNYESFRRSE